MNFVLMYWKQIAISAFIAIIFCFGYYQGYKHEKMRYDAFVSEIERDKQIAEIQNANILKQQTQITTNVAKEYANAVDKINSYYAGHPHIVRLCDSSSANAMPSTSESTTGTIAATQGTTEIDAQIASKEIAQCQALIEWERQQEEIK